MLFLADIIVFETISKYLYTELFDKVPACMFISLYMVLISLTRSEVHEMFRSMI